MRQVWGWWLRGTWTWVEQRAAREPPLRGTMEFCGGRPNGSRFRELGALDPSSFDKLRVSGEEKRGSTLTSVLSQDGSGGKRGWIPAYAGMGEG